MRDCGTPWVPAYLRRAKRRFLEGTPYRVPVDAVLAGRRTLERWVEVLNEERWLEFGSRFAPSSPKPAKTSGFRERNPR